MWYTWTTILLVSCALVEAAEPVETTTAAPAPVATTTRAPPRTLDRQAAELAWKSWLQSPESGNQNAPPRRITTKSLFITPLVCPKGQRLDRNGCVQMVTVNNEEHERILLDQLNALFTSAPSGDVLYDYGDEQPGPLQLSIPIALDPQAAQLQSQEPSAQAQEQPNYVKFDKKDENPIDDAGAKAELDLLKLQSSHVSNIDLALHINNTNDNQNVFYHPDKPKRDSVAVNTTELSQSGDMETGQKEIIFGHVNIDPVLYDTEDQKQHSENTHTDVTTHSPQSHTEIIEQDNSSYSTHEVVVSSELNTTDADLSTNLTAQTLSKDGDQTKLNPEHDYSDIGEAIKLISRYAEVTTDDNYSKDSKKVIRDDNVLGTRTKLPYRRDKPKIPDFKNSSPVLINAGLVDQVKLPPPPNNRAYYRYPWPSHSPTPPPDYPFKHLQDYWKGRISSIGGLYNNHENPRRHHHSYPHNYRSHGSENYPVPFPENQNHYPEALKGYIHRALQHRNKQLRSHGNNQELYSLLGLKHWLSSEVTSKR